MKYKVVIAYDGTAYSGWQHQDNAIGIQQVVEEVLAYLEGSPVRIFGSSRTDAGVHAKGFVGHFEITKPIPPKNLLRAMNSRLPEAVRILKASYAKRDFDARLSAKGKEYRYQLYQADILPPHLVPYWTFCHRPLDLKAMQRAAKYFVGKHDFRISNQRARNRHTLLLPTGKFAGIVKLAPHKPEMPQQQLRTALRFDVAPLTVEQKRHHHIVFDVFSAQKAEILENHANMAAAKFRRRRVRHADNVFAANLDCARVGRQKSRGKMKKRRFSAAARTHQRGKFTGLERQLEIFQNLALAVPTAHACRLQCFHRRVVSLYPVQRRAAVKGSNLFVLREYRRLRMDMANSQRQSVRSIVLGHLRHGEQSLDHSLNLRFFRHAIAADGHLDAPRLILENILSRLRTSNDNRTAGFTEHHHRIGVLAVDHLFDAEAIRVPRFNQGGDGRVNLD